MEKKKNSNTAMILVVLFVVGGFALLFCGGILAAIAVPAFMRYTTKSKTTEAAMVTRQMAEFARTAFVETCTFPEALPPATNRADCCGGEKCAPNDKLNAIWGQNIGALRDPSYFSYTATPQGESLMIEAKADFKCGGPLHTVAIEVTGVKTGETCDAMVSMPGTLNEFE